MARKAKQYKGVTIQVDRHGKQRARFRLKGIDCYLPHPSTPEFAKAYEQAMQGIIPRKPRVKARSVGDLIERFYASNRFNKGGDKWKAIVKSSLEEFRNEARDVPVEDFSFEHIEVMLRRRAVKRTVEKRVIGGPAAAARLHEQLIRLFDFAQNRLKWIGDNPAKEAELPVNAEGRGYHSWTAAEVTQFQERHPFGSMARLALEIAFWTGLRREDVARFGPDNIHHGRVVGIAGKTGKDVNVIAAPDLP